MRFVRTAFSTLICARTHICVCVYRIYVYNRFADDSITERRISKKYIRKRTKNITRFEPHNTRARISSLCTFFHLFRFHVFPHAETHPHIYVDSIRIG